MTSSNGNIFPLLALCVGNSPVTSEFPAQRPVTWSFDFFLSAPWINGWVNNHEAGDLRHHRAHYDVILMVLQYIYVCLLAIQANIKPTSLQVPVIPFGNWRALKVSWMVCIITGFLIVKKNVNPHCDSKLCSVGFTKIFLHSILHSTTNLKSFHI